MVNRRRSLFSPTVPSLSILEISSNGETVQRMYGIKELLFKVHGIYKYSGTIPLPQRYLPTQYRDLRRLDFSYTPIDEPKILVRKDAVIISLDPIRAIVTSDCIIILLPNDGDHIVYSSISNHIKRSFLNYRGFAFELEAYEAIIGAVVDLQKNNIQELEESTEKVLQLNKGFTVPPIYLQEQIIMLKQEITEKYESIKKYHQTIREVLASDEQMTLMNLTYFQNNPQFHRVEHISQILDIHITVEEILELYLSDYNSLVTRFSLLCSSLLDTIHLIRLQLDIVENRIQAWDTVFGITFVALLISNYIPTICGMNLSVVHFSDQNGALFWTVTLCTTAVGISYFIISLIFLRRKKVI